MGGSSISHEPRQAEQMANDPQGSVAQRLRTLAEKSGLHLLQIGGKSLLPVVQGGMGVGVSAGGLAGAVASMGAVGTISSIDLRRLHPDLMEETHPLEKSEDIPTAKRIINAANMTAFRREIDRARQIAEGSGLIAVNIMKALGAYAEYVKTALEAKVDALVVGAGLPLDLPDLAKDHPETSLIPILSDARGVQLLVKKWEKRGRLPDAVVIEHPRLAGGHLGAAKIADLNDPRFDFERVIPESLAFLRAAGIEKNIPLIAAGGIRSNADIRRLQSLGAAGVQLGTPFAVTLEGDAHPEFKRVLAEARDEDMVEFTSVAGLPARAVGTPWLKAYLKIEDRLQAVAHAKKRCTKAFDCLAQCGLRDGVVGWGQFCIDNQLAAALRGDLKKGLFFRGMGELPFGTQIRSVRELMERLLTRSVALRAV